MRAARLLLVLSVTATLLALPGIALSDDLSVAVTAPVAGSVVGGTVPVAASTGGPVTSVAFDWSGNGGGTWSPIGVDATPGDGWSASWDTTGTQGPALVRATATDGATQVSDQVSVTVDNAAPDLSLWLTRPAFSPNGDGVKDRTVAVIVLDGPATLDLAIEDAGGDVVRDLLEGSAAGAGETRVEWKGLIKQGGSWVTAPDGVYTFVATATDGAGNQSVATAELTLDTVAPTFSWVSLLPSPLLSASTALKLRFTIDDRFSDRLAISFTAHDSLGKVRTLIGFSRLVGTRTLSWIPRYASGKAFIPGGYTIRVTAKDDAGNKRVSAAEPFRSHRPVTTKVWRNVAGAGNRVALTFDDCVYSAAWDRILDILAARGVKASFFCNATYVDRYPGLARRTAAAGHTIGSHTAEHRYLPALTWTQIRGQIAADQAAWWRVAETTPAPYFRPPYGAYDSDVLGAAGSIGFLRTVMWDVDPQDWALPGSSTIASRVISNSRAGSIVVLHVRDQTASALGAMITGLRNKGLEPVSLARLFRSAGMR
ncbi:MAG: polysaccharide deacetylase family protein [Actinobacteria bacterium]|nr:polysaccharide deacetylase family protein [Actinomycetota bacterium]